jgi:acylglycerol lipase
VHHIEFTRQTPDKLQFYYQGWDPEASPEAVVCLVHGLGEHTGRYAHVAAALNDAGYAVLGFDLCGHGKSGGLRGHTPTYDALMDDLGCLLDEAVVRYPGNPQRGSSPARCAAIAHRRFGMGSITRRTTSRRRQKCWGLW